MSYSNNPLLPMARRKAINLVLKDGLSQKDAALRCGVNRTTIYRWIKKSKGLHGRSGIPTLSSKPLSCPHQTVKTIEDRVIELRR